MFGAILKSLRKQHKMTQEKLARILRVEPSSISKYESANVIPSVDTLEKIADIFDVSLDFLLGRPEKEMQNINEENRLNSAEDELIKSYRQLGDEDKAEVKGYINGLLRSNKNIYTKEATG